MKVQNEIITSTIGVNSNNKEEVSIDVSNEMARNFKT